MTTAHHPPSDLPIPPYLATEGRRPGASSGTGPGEIELVLMCLDYLRDLRRSHRAEGGSSSLANRGIDADWLSLSIYSLSRTLRPDTDLGSAFQDPDAAGNDPFFDPTSPAMMKSKQAGAGPAFKIVGTAGRVALPATMDGIDREVLYAKDPRPNTIGGRGGGGTSPTKLAVQRIGSETGRGRHGAPPARADDPADWYNCDDSHPSNSHRFYPMNGLESFRAPLSLPEVASAGLAYMGARSRLDAEREMVRSELFSQFLEAVSDKGFFHGVRPYENGDDGTESDKKYVDRYRKVVAKFRAKLGAKAAEGGGPLVLASLAGTAMSTGADDAGATLDAYTRERDRRMERGQPAANDELSHMSYNQTDHDEAERLKAAGNALMQKKEYGRAVDSYTTALKLCPTGPSSHVYYSNRAAALLSMKRLEEAIVDSERSLSLKPDYGKAYARLGLAQFLLGRYGEAVEAYELALRYEPDNKASRSYLEKARKKLMASRAPEGGAGPLDARDENGGGTVEVSITSPKRSENQRVVDEKEANQLKSRGNSLMASRDYEGAIAAYSRAIEMCPDGPNSHVYYSNRAAALCYLERYEEAEIDSESSVRLRPDYGKGYARLGLSRFFLRDYEGSLEAYEESLHLEPDNAASRSYHSKALRKLEMQRA